MPSQALLLLLHRHLQLRRAVILGLVPPDTLDLPPPHLQHLDLLCRLPQAPYPWYAKRSIGSASIYLTSTFTADTIALPPGERSCYAQQVNAVRRRSFQRDCEHTRCCYRAISTNQLALSQRRVSPCTTKNLCILKKRSLT